MRTYILAFILFGCLVSLSAQTRDQFIEDAEKQHELENYYGAYDSYRIATEFDESRMDLWYNQAENARLYTAYEIALRAYQEVLRNGNLSEFPELQFRLGQVNQFLGNYEEAASHYDQYLKQATTNADHRAMAEKNLKDCLWSMERMDDKDSLQVSHLPRDINTKYSDFSYRRKGDQSYFSSNRIKYEDDGLDPPRYLSRIFEVQGENTMGFEEMIAQAIQPGQHLAHTAFSVDQTRVYFTICEYVGDTESVRCDLHFTSVDGNGDWGTPTRMSINMDSVNTTQPHVAVDPLIGREALFFVSDREGGAGGLDIYRATLNEDGTAGNVDNLVAINTAGDDITPFLDTRACRLYFSTDGRETLGGFDIYYVSAKGGTIGDPVHLNYPVNGSFHDRYYTISREDGKAYFSSNRQNDYSISWVKEEEQEGEELENACCDDIYSVPFDETVLLDVYTFRKLDQTGLDRATVSLYQRNEDNSRVLVETQTQPSSNLFTFAIQPGNNYELEGVRPAFGPDDEVADLSVTCEVPDSSRIRRNLYFPQLLIVNVFDEKTREPLNGARLRLATDEASIGSPIADETKENTNRFEYLVSLERPYYIKAERIEYMSRDSSFSIPEALVNDQGHFTVDIYLPQPDPIELVPIDLYFDNDRPHPRSLVTRSDTQYVETNILYYQRKDAYIANILNDKDLSEEDKFLTEQALPLFFENDVLGGRNELISLAGALLERLKLGTRYTMNVEGRASKRGNPGYNTYLSERRVDSVLDFFREYEGGVLLPFINSGALEFKTSFVGDTKADASDTTIVGIKASRDRRVTITELKVKQ